MAQPCESAGVPTKNQQNVDTYDRSGGVVRIRSVQVDVTDVKEEEDIILRAETTRDRKDRGQAD